MKRDKIIYWVLTGLLCLLVTGSGTAYILQYEDVTATFATLGYPAHLVLLLAIAKLLAVTAILTKKSDLLKSWAYAGLLFDFLLALAAHLSVADGEQYGAIIALVLWAGSFYYDQKLFAKA